MPQVAHDSSTGTQCYCTDIIRNDLQCHTIVINLIPSGFRSCDGDIFEVVMCPCHEPLVAQVSICPNTFSPAECMFNLALDVPVSRMSVVCNMTSARDL